MKALISPNELVIGSDGVTLGFRVAQVSGLSFDVASPLFWVECSDDVVADQYFYADGVIQLIPITPEVVKG